MSALAARLAFCLVPAVLAGALAACVAPFFGVTVFVAVFGLGLGVTVTGDGSCGLGSATRPRPPEPPPPPPRK